MDTFAAFQPQPVPLPSAYKVIVLGDGGVGKTALVRRAADANLLFDSVPEKHISIDGANVRLLLYDMAPDQSRFWELRGQFYNGAMAAALVYDVSAPSSFFNLMHWRDEMQSFVPLLPSIVVGNKKDQVAVVPDEEVRGWADSVGMPFVLVNALTGEGVDSLFVELARMARQEQARREERQKAMRSIIR